jgi:metal-sulfur cluster biosynthetic enzyme
MTDEKGEGITPVSAEVARKALRAVKDPELGLNIIDIGLVYDVTVTDAGVVQVKMTLTSPGCPAGAEITADVKQTLLDLEGVTDVEIEIVWEPYWTPEKMDPRVRAFLGH